VCRGWHDLEQDWPEACAAHFRRPGASSIQIIKDIEPYRAVAADVDGNAPVIKSRREHREFLKRNNYIEVGNEKPKPRPPIEIDDPRPDLKRTIEQLRSNR
jgi:hypothetical protein